MNEIKLTRGGREIILKKITDRFAVRLKQGKAIDEQALEACCGRPKTEVKHFASAAPANMELFSVKEAHLLEDTMGELRKAPASDVVSHIYALDDTPGGAVIPTGTITVQFNPDVSESERERIFGEVNSNCKCTTSSFPKHFMGCLVIETLTWAVV